MFRRKGRRAVRMCLGDILEISVQSGGRKYVVQMTEITTDLYNGTTVTFAGLERGMNNFDTPPTLFS